MAEQDKRFDKAQMLASVRRAYRQGKLSREQVERLEAAGYNLSRGTLLPGVNDLATTHPVLAAQWHPTRNGDLRPSMVKAGSARSVWWLGECGHAWKASPSTRTRHDGGCPFCGRRKLLRGFNDLETRFPDVAAEWHPTRNGALTPADVLFSSNGKAWWKCKARGHEWASTIASRTMQGCGCPYCGNKRVLAGYNDLASKRPDLAAQWHPTKNGSLGPADVTYATPRKVWWVCGKGHEWQASVESRSRFGAGCPYCGGRKLLAGFNDLATTHPGLAAEWNEGKNGGMRSCDVMASSEEKVWWRCGKGHEWRAGISARVSLESGCPYCAGRQAIPGETDLASKRPDLAAEWHPTKNGGLKPSDVAAGTSRRVWWLGKCGHEWQASVGARNKRDSGCPYCSGRLPIPGESDLATTDPELAKEWHPTKNAGLSLSEIGPGSGKKVWWRCKEGHEWQAFVYSRAKQGTGCPYCGGKRAISGENDLATVNPALAGEWNREKNAGLEPCDVLPSSNKRVWWRCKEGHEWQATVNARNAGTRCPYCANRKVKAGFNDLATRNPPLAAQWHPTKNGETKPSDVTPGSGKRVWWRCGRCGFEWQATVNGRSRGSACPECGHRPPTQEDGGGKA